MTLKRLLTIQTWAVFSVIIFVCSNALAQTTGSITDEAIKSYYGGCSSIRSEISEATAAIGAFCGIESAMENSKLKQCVEERLMKCGDEAISAKESLLAPDPEEMERDPDLCGQIEEFNQKCPGAITITPEENAKNRKEIRSLRDDLRKERQEARKNDSDKLKQNQDEANKIMDEANKNDQDWAKQRKELGDKLRDILKQISADSMKMIQDMQKRLDDIDQEYIGYRNALRRKISVANDTELAWNTQCRAAANDAASAAEAELNKRMEAEALIVRNYRGNSLAGKMRRDLKIKRQRIINRYNEVLAKCLRGDTEPGSTAKLKLSQAKNDVRDSTAEANDKAARLEKLRQQITNNVNTVAQTLSDERQQAIQSNQQDMQLLDQAHLANQQRLQQRQQQMFQNQWRDSLEQMQGQKELNDRLNDLMGDEALASGEYMCHRKMSKERAAELNTTRSKAITGFFRIRQYCMPTSNGWVFKAPSDTAGGKCEVGNSDVCSLLPPPKPTPTPPPTPPNPKDERSSSSTGDIEAQVPPPAPTRSGTKGNNGRAGTAR